MRELTIEQYDLESETARGLIGELNAELSRAYPEEGANHFRLDPEEVADGRGAFLVASRGGKAVGCGAVRKLDERVGELKRMYVVPDERGTGIGRELLEALMAEARKLGLRRLVLETGTRQLAAAGLYEAAGFREIERFGEYIDSPLSLCMAKDL
jgi:N-acetylglutamate synthase-like GNAT family acetyltransferase